MATDKNYPIDLPILVIHAQICVAVKKFPFLPNKQIPNSHAFADIQGKLINLNLFHVTAACETKKRILKIT